MLPMRILTKVTKDLERDYAAMDDQSFTIESIVSHGEGIVVLFTRRYTGHDGRPSWENRVRGYQEDMDLHLVPQFDGIAATF